MRDRKAGNTSGVDVTRVGGGDSSSSGIVVNRLAVGVGVGTFDIICVIIDLHIRV